MAFREDLAWAGGLFEGEGCFTLGGNRSRRNRYARAQLKTTDLDVITRFKKSVGFGNISGPFENGHPDRKPIYAWSVQGFEKVQALVALLWSFLGQRRRERAREVLRAHGTERKVA